MDSEEIRHRLGLRRTIQPHRLPRQAIKAYAVGGAELLAFRSWALGQLNHYAGDAEKRQLAIEALAHARAIEAAMIAGLETYFGIDAGALQALGKSI